MCCSVGYNDGHTLLAIWDQASWLLLCSTETHIWKNPVSHFSPLPVLHKQNIGLRGWFLGFFYFVLFTLSILFMFLCKEEQKVVSQTKEFLLASWSLIFCIFQFTLTNTRSVAAYIEVLGLLSAQNYLWAEPVHWRVTLGAGAWRN